MKITYDPEADAAYIKFNQDRPQVTTIRVNNDVLIDIGHEKELIGIEILNATKNMRLIKGLKVELENLQAI